MVKPRVPSGIFGIHLLKGIFEQVEVDPIALRHFESENDLIVKINK